MQSWMEEKNLNTLYSISQWDQNIWLKWKMPTIPQRLKRQWEALKILLAGVAPINKQEQDEYFWGTIGGNYTVKSGYNHL